MRHALIFDIDGTLLDSCESDAELYRSAIRHVLGEVQIREAWGLYSRVTDTGILAEVCSDNGLKYDEAVSVSVMDVFVDRLSVHILKNGPYQEIPGALRYVRESIRRPDARVAYATGGWRASARLKLASAGFPVDGVVLASASDFQERTQVMLHALSQLAGPFESVTYFGDGLWDQLATAELGWKFVPIGPKLGGLSSFDQAAPLA